VQIINYFIINAWILTEMYTLKRTRSSNSSTNLFYFICKQSAVS